MPMQLSGATNRTGPRLWFFRLAAVVVVAAVAAGIVCFKTFTPMVSNLPPFNWHLLALPWTEGVETRRAGLWHTLQFGLYVFCWIALACSLWWVRARRAASPASDADPPEAGEEQPPGRWWRRAAPWRALGVLAYGALCGAGVGQFSPFWLRWVALVPVPLLLWRRRPSAAALLLVAAAATEAALVSMTQIYYGVSVGSPLPALAVVTGGAAAGVWAIHRRWLLGLPAVALAVLGLIQPLYREAIHRHHDMPASARQCQGLQARILNPLVHRRHQPAWVVIERKDGLVVAGVDFIMLLSHDGGVLHQAELRGADRVQDIILDSDGVVAVGSTRVVRWVPGQPARTVLEDRLADRTYVEWAHVANVAGRLYVSGVIFPVIYSLADNRQIYLGQLQSHLVTGVAADPSGRRLFVWDLDGVGEADPRTLEVKRFRRFGLWRLGAVVVAGRDRLYRARQFTKAVDVLDSRTFEVERTLRMDFGPRFLAFDPREEVLAASDTLGQEVSLWDLRRGRHLGNRRVGPRPRGLAYSNKLGAFVGVSACGLYQLAPSHGGVNP